MGTRQIVDILREKGYHVDNKPTAKVSDEAFNALVTEINKLIHITKQEKETIDTSDVNEVFVPESGPKSVAEFCNLHGLSWKDFIALNDRLEQSVKYDLESVISNDLLEKLNNFIDATHREVEEKYEPGTVLELKIVETCYPSGLKIKFEEFGYTGFIPLQNIAYSIAWAEKTFPLLQPGKSVKCVVYSYDHINKVCVLSLKHLRAFHPPSLFKGDFTRGQIIEYFKSKSLVELENGGLGISNSSQVNTLFTVLGYNEVKDVYHLEEYVDKSEKLNIKQKRISYEDYTFIEEDLRNYLNFEKSSFGAVASQEEKDFLRQQFRKDEKLFSRTLNLRESIYLKFFNNRSWEEFEREIGEEEVGEAFNFLANSAYWIRYQVNERHQKSELTLHNEQVYIKATVTDLDGTVVLVINSFSIGRKDHWSALGKKCADNFGALLNQAEIIFLSPYDNIPFDANQEAVIDSIQEKFQAFDILKSLKVRTGKILQTEGEALRIFERFLEYQIALEEKREREPVRINQLANYPSSVGCTRYLIKPSDKLEIAEGVVEIGENKATKQEGADDLFWKITTGRLFEEDDQWILEVRNDAPDLAMIDTDLFIRERLQVSHLISQQEIIEDFLNNKINVGHIEKLLVDPDRIKPPKAAKIEFKNANLATTFINDPRNKQIEAVRKGVGNQNILLIQGPPGTGKTTVIAEIVQQLIAKGETILIASQGHVAVDNVLEKLADTQDLLMTRIGSEEKIAPNLLQFQEKNALQDFTEWYGVFVENQLAILDDFLKNDDIKVRIVEYVESYPNYLQATFKNYHHELYQLLLVTEADGTELTRSTLEEWRKSVSIQKDSLMKALFYKHLNIAFGTCLGLKNSRDLSDYNVSFDTLILDEAGKANMAETFVAISLAKKVILVGDQKQLPPYLDSSLIDQEDDKSFPNSKIVSKVEFEKLKQALSSSFFEFLVNKIEEGKFPMANLVMLDIQHRMHPSIGNLVSESFYGSEVQSASHTQNNQIALPSPFDREIVFVDTSNDANSYEEKVDDTSYVNKLEAAYITNEIIPRLLEGGISTEQIAVISPYKYQVNLIKSRLKENLPLAELTVETLDSFQGKEFDVIIISFTRSHKYRRVGFLDDARRLNVALSRAKKKLVLVGNSKTLCSPKSHFDQVYNYTGLFKKLVSISADSDTGNFFQLSDKFSFIPAKPVSSTGLEVGDILRGEVKNITAYGAFIELENGITGLCYINDLAYRRIDHPTDVVSLTNKVKVKVLNIREGRISLGIKQLFPHPWESFIQKYEAGQLAKGKVVYIKEYGAFLEIIPGVEGLLHVSQMSNTNPIESFKVGRVMDVIILTVDAVNRKISLGLHHAKNSGRVNAVRRRNQSRKKVTINGVEIKRGQYYPGRFSTEIEGYFKIILSNEIVGYLKKTKDSRRRIEGLDQLPEELRLIKVRIDDIQENNRIILTLA